LVLGQACFESRLDVDGLAVYCDSPPVGLDRGGDRVRAIRSRSGEGRQRQAGAKGRAAGGHASRLDEEAAS
jgi:hypothetical protein